jgi:hypothetical protein
LRLEGDSLYHPSVSLRYMRDKKFLSLIKKEEGLSKAPFYSTYHQLDMFFEVLTWKQGDPVVQMGNLQGSTQTRASFESFDYFKEKRYMAMLGIDAVHPERRHLLCPGVRRVQPHAEAGGDPADDRHGQQGLPDV